MAKKKKVGLTVENCEDVIEDIFGDECQHDKADVNWRSRPSLSDGEDGSIPWYGRCKCGKLVYEVYEQQPEVYEANE